MNLYGEGNGSPLRYFCLGNPVDRGAWWATFCEATESWKQLSMYLRITESLCCMPETKTTL